MASQALMSANAPRVHLGRGLSIYIRPQVCRPQNLQASFTMYASERPQSATRGIPVLSVPTGASVTNVLRRSQRTQCAQ